MGEGREEGGGGRGRRGGEGGGGGEEEGGKWEDMHLCSRQRRTKFTRNVSRN